MSKFYQDKCRDSAQNLGHIALVCISGASLAWGMLATATLSNRAGECTAATCSGKEHTTFYNLDYFATILEIIVAFSVAVFSVLRANCSWKGSEMFYGTILTLLGVALTTGVLLETFAVGSSDTCKETGKTCFSGSVLPTGDTSGSLSSFTQLSFVPFPLNPYLAFAFMWVAMKVAKMGEMGYASVASRA